MKLKQAYSANEPKTVQSLVKHLNSELKTKTFLVNEKITLADIALFPMLIDFAKSLKEKQIAEFNHFVRWFDLLQNKFVVQETVKFDEPNMKDLNLKDLSLKDSNSKKDSSSAKAKKQKKPEPTPLDPISRIDIRVGKITAIKKHPEADSLFIETVDFGTETKTVVSGLVGKIEESYLLNRLACFVFNLKPVKMRGVFSQGMILCASDESSLEVLSPPENSLPGDLISCESFERTPDDVMNPKKKIMETAKEDLKVIDGVATYKGKRLYSGKGNVSASTVLNGMIS